ncbi:ABC transporter substrate-binding protein [Methylocystaceae bacterium]|nr:ABC transporter substrate-binding protein [Methylocystaceae bacterium]
MAHPHVWVAVQSEVVFGNDGRIVGVRHSWEFDEMYSAFATQGLGKNGAPPTKEELAPLAKTNIESLAEFDYFTFAKQNNEKPAFKPPQDVTLEVNERKSVVMHFFLPLQFPASAKKPFSFQVYDPTYFVSFGLEKKEPVRMSRAPAGCSLSLVEPSSLVATDNQKLSEAFFQNMSPGADFGIKLATRAIVACP